MKQYGLNKIFVEGKSDKLFIDFILKLFFDIDDSDLVIDVRGKDKLIDQPLLSDARRVDEGAKNIVIFDTDTSETNGGRERRLQQLKAIEEKLSIEFKIYLLPFDDNTEGILEDLLNGCINNDFVFFDSCWDTMIDCINKSEFDKLNIPAQKGFLYSKIDLFKNYRNTSWDYKGSAVYNYSDSNIWTIEPDENEKLKKLLDFIGDNLFND